MGGLAGKHYKFLQNSVISNIIHIYCRMCHRDVYKNLDILEFEDFAMFTVGFIAALFTLSAKL
ncbi:hypothetical protein SAMN05216326_1394 [Nitrosomonas marina]|uniref:Uncharacterized protein n=1 Tax=Nitrosomonas marina TaxID=917 RepID=A0A1I0FIG3_9PROT|nr:hypothetical protein SAMN05216326_1394 [Nitrosomonas marina]